MNLFIRSKILKEYSCFFDSGIPSLSPFILSPEIYVPDRRNYMNMQAVYAIIAIWKPGILKAV